MEKEQKKNIERIMNNTEIKFNFYLIPLMLIVAIVPSIVFMKKIEFGEFFEQYWSTGNLFGYDYFAFYKVFLLYIFTVSLLIGCIVGIKKGFLQEKKIPFLIPTAIIVVFSLFSTLFSENPEVAVWGIFERFEGFLTILAYMAILLTSFTLIRHSKDAKWVLGVLIFSAMFISTIGFFQFFGFDLFSTEIGRLWILPRKFHDLASQIRFLFPAGTVYATLYNPNYVGSYMTILFILTITLTIFEKKQWLRIFLSLLTGLYYFILIASFSRAGFFAAVVSLMVGAWLLRKKFREQFLAVLGILAGLVMIFWAVDAYSGKEISGRVQRMLDADVAVKKQMESGAEFDAEKLLATFPFTLKDNVLSVKTEEETLFFSLKEKKLRIFNENGEVVSLEPNPKNRVSLFVYNEKFKLKSKNEILFFTLIDEQFVVLDAAENVIETPRTPPIDAYAAKDSMLTIQSGEHVLKIFNQDFTLSFYDEKDRPIQAVHTGDQNQIILTDRRFIDYTFVSGKFAFRFYKNRQFVDHYKYEFIRYPITVNGEEQTKQLHLFQPFTEIPKMGFEGFETLGSGRGFIWSRSLPLLSQTWFLGFGPDTYVAYFPQHDYEAKAKIYKDENILVDKPHNYYLQWALGSGIPALIAFLYFVAHYIVTTIRLFKNNHWTTEEAGIRLAIFLAIIGYLVVGVFNDSVVSVSPIFWSLMGMGYAVNVSYQKNESLSEMQEGESVSELTKDESLSKNPQKRSESENKPKRSDS